VFSRLRKQHPAAPNRSYRGNDVKKWPQRAASLETQKELVGRHFFDTASLQKSEKRGSTSEDLPGGAEKTRGGAKGDMGSGRGFLVQTHGNLGDSEKQAAKQTRFWARVSQHRNGGARVVRRFEATSGTTQKVYLFNKRAKWSGALNHSHKTSSPTCRIYTL
jgi:hypothetical protein